MNPVRSQRAVEAGRFAETVRLLSARHQPAEPVEIIAARWRRTCRTGRAGTAIYVGALTLSAPPSVQRFTAAHEMGHIVAADGPIRAGVRLYLAGSVITMVMLLAEVGAAGVVPAAWRGWAILTAFLLVCLGVVLLLAGMRQASQVSQPREFAADAWAARQGFGVLSGADREWIVKHQQRVLALAWFSAESGFAASFDTHPTWRRRFAALDRTEPDPMAAG